jgi:hypothetical protein
LKEIESSASKKIERKKIERKKIATVFSNFKFIFLLFLLKHQLLMKLNPKNHRNAIYSDKNLFI